MKINSFLKTALFAIVAACALWSCDSSDEKVRYVAVVLDGEEKWSFLDTKTGEILCKNDFAEMPSMVCDGLFVVKNSKGYYECYDISNPKEPISKGGKYTQLGLFGPEGVAFAVKEGKGITIIDKDFEEVKKLPKNVSSTRNFSEGLAAFCKDGKWGFLDKKGDEVIAAKYEGVTDFSEGRAFGLKGEKILLIDKKGDVIKSFSTSRYSLLSHYHNGTCAVTKGDKVVFLDKDGEEKFTDSKMQQSGCYYIDEGKTVFCHDNSYGLISTDGEVLIRARYEGMLRASKNRYMVHQDDKEFVVDASGEKIIAPEYESIAQISTALDHYFVYDGKTWTLINEKGEEVSKESFQMLNFVTTRSEVFYSEATEMWTSPYNNDVCDSTAIDDEYYDYADSAY